MHQFSLGALVVLGSSFLDERESSHQTFLTALTAPNHQPKLTLSFIAALISSFLEPLVRLREVLGHAFALAVAAPAQIGLGILISSLCPFQVTPTCPIFLPFTNTNPWKKKIQMLLLRAHRPHHNPGHLLHLSPTPTLLPAKGKTG